ncbi:MAG: HAMP domain-containing protein [Deferrisomatales bacterium]
MFKTLAARAIVPIALAVTGFVVVCSVLLYSSMKQDRIEEHILHATDIAQVLVQSTRFAMLKEDRETLRNIVANVGDERLVQHVRIFNKQGLIVFSDRDGEVGALVDKEAEGCAACHAGADPLETLGPMEQARRFVTEAGEPVLAITAAIYNEPDCSSAPCHYHPPEQRVLGTLDIGLSEEALQRNLGVMGKRLAAFGAMVLVLCVGGVAGLLALNVVGPVRRLAAVAAHAAFGPDGGAAGGPSGELETIARAVETLRRRVEESEAPARRDVGSAPR